MGDKRAREEDSSGSQDLDNQIEQRIATVSDSNPNTSGTMNGHVGNRNGNTGIGGGVNDALYIGDLQWVRTSFLAQSLRRIQQF